MRLAAANRVGARFAGLSLGASMLLMGLAPVAHAAGPVTYSITPTSGTVQPGGGITMALSFNTTVPIAGASVNITYGNGSFAGFQAANNPSINFIDYHAEQNDIVFICSNNRCEPGTYSVANITVKAGTAGSVRVTYTPKETANPQLGLITADGVVGSYTINKTGPSYVGTKPTSGSGSSAQNTYVIPEDDGSGNLDPLVVTGDQLNQQTQKAQQALNDGTDGDGTQWSTGKLLLVGAGGGAGVLLLLFIIFRIVKKWLNPTNFGGPSNPNNTFFPQ